MLLKVVAIVQDYWQILAIQHSNCVQLSRCTIEDITDTDQGQAISVGDAAIAALHILRDRSWAT